jgi:hypothetical protein
MESASAEAVAPEADVPAEVMPDAVDVVATHLPTAAPAERTLLKIEPPIGPISSAVLDRFLDSESDWSMKQIKAALANVEPNAVETAVRREYLGLSTETVVQSDGRNKSVPLYVDRSACYVVAVIPEIEVHHFALHRHVLRQAELGRAHTL